jgi:UDP-4-amino-4,6-dideoxy-N-acetyl-beta-L-altrosamine N-acetyltransferase
MKLKKIKLKVFSDNKKAINFYEKSGFKKIGKKQIKNREVISMELNREQN